MTILQVVIASALYAQEPQAPQDTSEPEPTSVLGVLLFDDGAPVAQARISLVGTEHSALSDADGRFLLVDNSSGAAELEIQHIALGVLRYRLPPNEAARRSLALTLPRRVIALEGIDVWARTRADEYRRRVGTRVDLLIRSDIDRVIGASHLGHVIQNALPLMVFEMVIAEDDDPPQPQLCVTAVRQMGRGRTNYCAAVVIDGFRVVDGGAELLNMGPDEVESIEYLPPTRAGAMYGTGIGNRGVVVIWTRGRGPFAEQPR